MMQIVVQCIPCNIIYIIIYIHMIIYIYIYICVCVCVCGILYILFLAGQNAGYAGTRCIYSIFPKSSAGICEDIS